MRTAAIVLLLAGCEHWVGTCEDTADWSIPITRGTTNEGAEAVAARAPDGSIVLAIGDPFSDVQFGDQRLHGPHVARVSADGQIVATVPVALPVATQGPQQIRAVGDRIAVLWPGTPSTLDVRDADLNPVWVLPASTTYFGVTFDLGPQGEVAAAVVKTDATNVQTTELVLFAPDGSERWRHPLLAGETVATVRVTDTGDVMAVVSSSATYRKRYAAADGAELDYLAVPFNPEFLQRDGSFWHTGYQMYDGAGAVVERYDAAGKRVWQSVFRSGPLSSPILTETGDQLVAMTGYEALHGTDVRTLIIDAATGKKVDERRTCGFQFMFSADRDVYFALGAIDSSSTGLGRYPL